MNKFKYLTQRGWDLGTLTEEQVFQGERGSVVLRPRTLIEASHCFGLVDQMQVKGISATIMPEPGSWADKNWAEVLELLHLVPDDLPF